MTTTTYIRKRRPEGTTPEGTLKPETWHVLHSPDGEYPSGGYVAKDTGCRTLAELREREHLGENVRLQSI